MTGRLVQVAALLILSGLLGSNTASAQFSATGSSTSTAFCDRHHAISADEQDRVLRFAAAVRDVLNTSGADTALISRSGLDLSRFHLRYSHAAILTRDDAGQWTARQLYYACDEGHPRIFDQGLAGFTSGSDDPSTSYISLVILPPDAAQQLRRAAADNSIALRVLGTTYSANAYPFSTAYQNCNQWVMEMLAQAWGPQLPADEPRATAQQWLAAAHYDPQPVNVNSGILMIATAFTPMLHLDDHPKPDREAMRLKVSLPSTIEAFVHDRLPDSQRIEVCHHDARVVIHQGWEPVGEACQPGPADQVIRID